MNITFVQIHYYYYCLKFSFLKETQHEFQKKKKERKLNMKSQIGFMIGPD